MVETGGTELRASCGVGLTPRAAGSLDCNHVSCSGVNGGGPLVAIEESREGERKREYDVTTKSSSLLIRLISFSERECISAE